MSVDLKLLQPLVHGAVEVVSDGKTVSFNRMNAAEMTVYAGNPDFYRKCSASAGIKLEFFTDAAGFSLEGVFSPGSSRNFAYADVTVNGVLTAHCGTENFSEEPELKLSVTLDGKLNKVNVYFPGIANLQLTDFSVRDFTRLEPVKKSRKMICYGDSITQGYDARYPSLAYANVLAEAWDAEMVNKAVGGEIFNPALASAAAGKADLLTVAYGTNDWSCCTLPEIRGNAGKFFERLVAAYPDTPALVLLPIWRKDCTSATAAGSFDGVRTMLAQIAGSFPQITVIDGWELVPHLPEFFSADGLHPNDFGFSCMGQKILQKVKKW